MQRPMNVQTLLWPLGKSNTPFASSNAGTHSNYLVQTFVENSRKNIWYLYSFRTVATATYYSSNNNKWKIAPSLRPTLFTFLSRLSLVRSFVLVPFHIFVRYCDHTRVAFLSALSFPREMTKSHCYCQCDQIGRFLHFGQLFKVFGNN